MSEGAAGISEGVNRGWKRLPTLESTPEPANVAKSETEKDNAIPQGKEISVRRGSGEMQPGWLVVEPLKDDPTKVTVCYFDKNLKQAFLKNMQFDQVLEQNPDLNKEISDPQEQKPDQEKQAAQPKISLAELNATIKIGSYVRVVVNGKWETDWRVADVGERQCKVVKEIPGLGFSPPVDIASNVLYEINRTE